MKRQTLSLVFATLAFALPCLAQGKFAFCETNPNPLSDLREFYSAVFSVESDDYALKVSMAEAFLSRVKATYGGEITIANCDVFKTLGEAQGALDDSKANYANVDVRV